VQRRNPVLRAGLSLARANFTERRYAEIYEAGYSRFLHKSLRAPALRRLSNIKCLVAIKRRIKFSYFLIRKRVP